MRPLQRLRLLRRVQSWARLAGRLDARGELGTLGLAFLREARREAAAAGCDDFNVDEATVDGYAEGQRSEGEQSGE